MNQNETIDSQASEDILEKWADREYKEGFVSNVEADTFEPGLSEDVVRRLSAIKNEPA